MNRGNLSESHTKKGPGRRHADSEIVSGNPVEEYAGNKLINQAKQNRLGLRHVSRYRIINKRIEVRQS